jgi:hypothetical protein
MTIAKLVATCFGLSQPSSGQYEIKTKQMARYKIQNIKYAPNGIPLCYSIAYYE